MKVLHEAGDVLIRLFTRLGVEQERLRLQCYVLSCMCGGKYNIIDVLTVSKPSAKPFEEPFVS